eukprot:TRINITY_DN2479_c0_g2_i1.p1 TRINITY_DN2479_c0_g2~~TRINITY_DN2479_c0_g2_i1.p1  ORF type:complete len:612 (+),score=127.64 TRINITY_DN2479_c0_g2_i1:262-2097(+)
MSSQYTQSNNARMLPNSFTQPKGSKTNTTNNNNDNSSSFTTPISKPSAKKGQFSEPPKRSTPFKNSTPTRKATTPSARKPPTPKPNTKNQSTHPSESASTIRLRIERASKGDLLIIYRGEYRADPPSQFFYVTNKDSHRVYAVTIQQVSECTCPDFLRGHLCKHIYFLLLKAFHVPKDSPILLKARVIPASDLQQMFTYTFDPLDDFLLAPAAIREKFRDLYHTDFRNIHGSNRKPIGGNCAYCDRLMQNINDTIWCKMCGENVHRDCFEPLVQAQKQYGKTVNCLKCNRSWDSTPAHYLKISSTFNKPPKGFVEHSWSHLVERDASWIIEDGGFGGVTVALDDCGYLMLIQNGPASIPDTRSRPIPPVARPTPSSSSSARDNIHSRNWNEDTDTESDTESESSTEIEDNDTEVDSGTENEDHNIDNNNNNNNTQTQYFQTQTTTSQTQYPQTQTTPSQTRREPTQSSRAFQTSTTVTQSFSKQPSNVLPVKREYIELDDDTPVQDKPQPKSNIAFLKTELKGEPFILAKIETSQLPQIPKQESQIFVNTKKEEKVSITPKKDSIQVQYSTPNKESITLIFPKNELRQFQPPAKKRDVKREPNDNEIIILE